MVTFLTIVHITVCLFLILVVLLQAGKGGGMGIAFGGAGSQTVFGSSGAGNFLTRLTSITATIFLLTSLALAHYSSRQDSRRLQHLASQRASEKKVDDEKAAKLKADLEKARAAMVTGKDAGAGAAAPEGAAGATGAIGTEPLPVPATGAGAMPTRSLKLDLPKLGTKPTGGTAAPAAAVTKPVVGVGAPGAAPKAPPRRKPAVVSPPVAPAPEEAPAAPAAPSE